MARTKPTPAPKEEKKDRKPHKWRPVSQYCKFHSL